MIIIENFIIIYKYLLNKINPSYYPDIKFIGYNDKNKDNNNSNNNDKPIMLNMLQVMCGSPLTPSPGPTPRLRPRRICVRCVRRATVWLRQARCVTTRDS